MSSDVDQLVEKLLTERSYYAFTAPNNSPLGKCFDFVLTVLQDNWNFSNIALVIPYDGCQIIELSRAMQTFIVIVCEGDTTSAMLVDKNLPKQVSFVDLLNQCMLTLWTRVTMNPALLCGILINFADGSLVATAQYLNDCARTSVTIRNIFVKQVLFGVPEDNRLEQGLPLLQEAMKKHLSSLKLELPPVRRFKVDNRLSSTKDEFKLTTAANSIMFVKFLADFAKIQNQL